MLGSRLCRLDQIDKLAFALSKSGRDRLFGLLREIFILYHKVVQIVAEVVCAGRTPMTIKHAKEAYLGPVNVQVPLRVWLEYV